MTFVIYILEVVANLTIFVVWFFIHQKTSDYALTLSVLWFHVILPYTFLMNTSHNKNVVLDEGWWNTIRNTLGISAHFRIHPLPNTPTTVRDPIQQPTK